MAAALGDRGTEPAPARLPPFSDRGFAIFRIAWVPALIAAIIAPAGGAWLRLARAGAGFTGATSLAVDMVPPALLIVTAVLLYRRRGRDVVAALLSLSFLLMSASFFAAEGFFRAFDLTWLRDFLAHLGRAALILVLLVFPNGAFVPRWTLAAASLLLVWALVAWLGPVALDVEYLGYLFFLGLGVLSIAVPYRRLAAGLERQQVRWVLFGFAAGTLLLAAAVAVTYVPETPGTARSWTDLVAQILAALGMACFTLGLLVSLLRYRLYDADAVISRSAGYAVLTIMLGAVFAAGVKGVEAVIEAWFGGEAGALPGIAGAGLAMALVTPLNERIQSWAERRFRKGLIELRRDLPDCVHDLRETAGLAELLDEVLERVAAGVRAARAAILVDGSVAATRDVAADEVAAWLARAGPGALSARPGCDRDDPLFPMRVPLLVRHRAAAPIGWMLLGPRPDGSFYGADEREAIADIADPVARAVQIVLSREQRERALEARFAALERAIEGAAGDVEAQRSPD